MPLPVGKRDIAREIALSNVTDRLKYVGSWFLAGGIASAGALTFLVLSMPLPFVLGPMIFCLTAALFQLPVTIPKTFRPPMSAIIGVMLGSAFTPDILATLPNWIGTIAGLVFFLGLSALVCVAYYRKLARYDLGTAYFSGMPGGLIEMILLGEKYGADIRRIALAHSARILLVVFSLPFISQIMIGEAVGRGVSVEKVPLTVESVLWLAGTAIAGVLLGRALKLPAWALLGPMALSAVIHVAGISSFKPPSDIVTVAQIVIGTSIGCRFAGMTVKEFTQILTLATGAIALQLTIMILCAYGVAAFVPYEPIELVLAYSPGGLTEMGLIALALGSDVAFVAGHHILRVVIVSLGAAWMARKFL